MHQHVHLLWIPHSSPPPRPLTPNWVRTSSLTYPVFLQQAGLCLWFPCTPPKRPPSFQSCPPTIYISLTAGRCFQPGNQIRPFPAQNPQILPNPLELKFKYMAMVSEAQLALVTGRLSNDTFYHFLSSLLPQAPLLTSSLLPASLHLCLQLPVLVMPFPSSLWGMLPHFMLNCWLRGHLLEEASLDSPSHCHSHLCTCLICLHITYHSKIPHGMLCLDYFWLSFIPIIMEAPWELGLGLMPRKNAWYIVGAWDLSKMTNVKWINGEQKGKQSVITMDNQRK